MRGLGERPGCELMLDWMNGIEIFDDCLEHERKNVTKTLVFKEKNMTAAAHCRLGRSCFSLFFFCFFSSDIVACSQECLVYSLLLSLIHI